MLRGGRELPRRGHRRRRVAPVRLTALLVLTSALIGCEKDAADSGAYAFAGDGPTYNGLYHLVTEMSPDPPTVGGAALAMFLTTAADEVPVEAASVAVVVADAFGEALSVAPMVGMEGGGSYVASWYYPEGGSWSIRVNIEGDAGSDYAILYVLVN